MVANVLWVVFFCNLYPCGSDTSCRFSINCVEQMMHEQQMGIFRDGLLNGLGGGRSVRFIGGFLGSIGIFDGIRVVGVFHEPMPPTGSRCTEGSIAD